MNSLRSCCNTLRLLSLTSLSVLSIFAFQTQALTMGDWFLDPNISVAFNSVQGTAVRFGLDVGTRLDENFYTGIGAYYTVGKNPNHDREIGGGPFLGYVYPLSSFLTLHLREDIDYVDVRTPVLTASPDQYNDHVTDYGIESGSTVGLSLSFSRSFGVSVGYRLAVGLTNSHVADGRSGTFFGLSIGF